MTEVSADDAADPRAATVMTVAVLAAFSASLMLSPVNVAVPDMLQAFRVDVAAGSWIPLAYLLAVAVTVVPAGRAAEHFGRIRVFAAALAIGSMGSAAAAAAQSLTILLVARGIQGVGSGMCFAVSAALITHAVAPHERGEKLGIALTATYFGLTVGPLIGGALTAFLNWRWVFLFPLPLLALALAVTLFRLLPHQPVTAASGRYDFAGAALYVAAMTASIVGVAFLPEPWAIGVALVGAALGAVFLRHAYARPRPVFDVRLFLMNRVFARSCFASVLMYAAIFSTTFVMSLYFQDVRGIGPLASGFILMAQPVFMATLARPVGRLSDVHEPRVLASAGLLISMAGLLVMSGAGAKTWVVVPTLGLALSGLGMALFSSPNHNAIMGGVTRTQLGTASAALAVMRIVGQMLSMVTVALVFSVLSARDGGALAPDSELLTGVKWSLRIAALLCVVGVYLSWTRGDLHVERAGG